MKQLLSELDSWPDILAQLRFDTDQLQGPDRAWDRGLTRQRLASVLDRGEFSCELGRLAGYELYPAFSGPSCPVVAGIGSIQNRPFCVTANMSVEGFSPFSPIAVKKVLRAQSVALDNRIPLLYLIGSSGQYLPVDHNLYPDDDDFSLIQTRSAQLARLGVLQIVVALGPISPQGVLLPSSPDHLILGPGSSGRLRFSRGQVHDARNDEQDWVGCVAGLAESTSLPQITPYKRTSPTPPERDPEQLYDLVPLDPSSEYDTREVINCIFDGGSFLEYKAEYGKTLVCGYARLDGWSVGVIGNQKQHTREPGRPYEVGGVIYQESADKGARFVMDCNQNRLPLVFLQDVNGFMVGRSAEVSGIIKSGAKLVNVVANSVVPKLTVILGGSYGAGNYALCGKAYDPRFILAWPTCRYAVMGGDQAARTLLALRVRQLEREGRKVDDNVLEELRSDIRQRYWQQLDPRFAASRLWVDAIVEPHQTRRILATALEVVTLNSEIKDFKTGVLQV